MNQNVIIITWSVAFCMTNQKKLRYHKSHSHTSVAAYAFSSMTKPKYVQNNDKSKICVSFIKKRRKCEYFRMCLFVMVSSFSIDWDFFSLSFTHIKTTEHTHTIICLPSIIALCLTGKMKSFEREMLVHIKVGKHLVVFGICANICLELRTARINAISWIYKHYTFHQIIM